MFSPSGCSSHQVSLLATSAAAAQHFADRHGLNVTGVTVSAAQAARARVSVVGRGSLCILQRDWLANSFAAECFDRAYAVESSEHVSDKQQFFDEAFRTLKPGGLLAVCAWLARTDPRPWQVRDLLEPICREGRLSSMGDEADYRGSPSRQSSAWSASRISVIACGGLGGSARGAH